MNYYKEGYDAYLAKDLNKSIKYLRMCHSVEAINFLGVVLGEKSFIENYKEMYESFMYAISNNCKFRPIWDTHLG